MEEVPASREEVGEGFFRPPLYEQRYLTTTAILRDERWSKDIKKIVDLGCAELSLVRYLKTLPHVEHLVEVDIDGQLLETYKHRAAPLLTEYLTKNQRDVPLTIDIYKGSIAENDSILMGADAVLCIELIEHLNPDVLEMVPKTIFGCVQPLVVIITTPNADFNPLFSGFQGFRHWDHKFEWTRSEFEMWAKSVVEKYPNYKYELSGVGNPPEGREDVGHCSQIAVFHRQYTISSPQVIGEFYELVQHYEYPFLVDERSGDEKIGDEVTYHVHLLSKYEIYNSSEDDIAFIPLEVILHRVQESYPDCTEEKFRDVASKKFNIETNSEGVAVFRIDLYDSSSDEEEKDTGENPVLDSSAACGAEEEDWTIGDKPATEEPEAAAAAVAAAAAAAVVVDPVDLLPLDIPTIDTSWAVEENEANQLAESLRAANLLLPPPPGYFGEDDDDDFHDLCDVESDYDDFDNDIQYSRGDDSEWMCMTQGSRAKTDAAFPIKEKTDANLSTVRQFPKSTSVEVLHHEGPPLSKSRRKLVECGDSTTLCYTGEGPYPVGEADDSCSLDEEEEEPDRAADSGYPNSSSLNQEADVDADLTPEQVDDISRSEDGEPSLSEDEHSDDERAGVNQNRPAVREPRIPLPVVFANVENGDLANNNRDGEGNNAAPEDDIPGLALEFAAVVHEENQAPLLGAAAPPPGENVDVEQGILPDHADPFPPWLSNLLGFHERDVGAIRASGDDIPDLSDTDEGLGDESNLSWSGDATARV